MDWLSKAWGNSGRCVASKDAWRLFERESNPLDGPAALDMKSLAGQSLGLILPRERYENVRVCAHTRGCRRSSRDCTWDLLSCIVVAYPCRCFAFSIPSRFTRSRPTAVDEPRGGPRNPVLTRIWGARDKAARLLQNARLRSSSKPTDRYDPAASTRPVRSRPNRKQEN